ncbi:hypothetical protein ACFWOG_17240 [Kitasatospora sp. NPDC058406]|uniref:hypothetical protein n=1 Tax=Kitasatospora sp. NPDC058406 TaxID=3346483 RepID=UPI003659E31E
MSDTITTTGLGVLPHQAYAEAVANIDGPGGHRAPDDWYTDHVAGELTIQLWYRRTEPRPATASEAASMPADQLVPAQYDAHGARTAPAMLSPLVDAEHWPWGLTVAWGEKEGWLWTALVNEDSEITPWSWEPLPVPLLASPEALHAALAPLFAGQVDDLPAQTDEWSPRRPDALADRLANRR